MPAITFPEQPWTNGMIHSTVVGDFIYVTGKGWQTVSPESRLEALRMEVEEALAYNATDEDLAIALEELEIRIRDNPTVNTTQVVVATAGANPVDLGKGLGVHVSETDGVWWLEFQNIPSGGATVRISAAISNNGDAMEDPNGSWEIDSSPPTSWLAGTTVVVTGHINPFVNETIYDPIYVGPTPTGTVVPPTISALYSLSPERTNPLEFSGSLPTEDKAVFVTASDPSVVEEYRFFWNHIGPFPDKGAEGETYIGSSTTAPNDMLGSIDGLAVMWNSVFDPTGNLLSSHLKNGVNTLWVLAHIIDGTTVITDFPVMLTHVESGATPIRTAFSQGFPSGDSEMTVNILDGVDRMLIVSAHYTNNTATGNVKTITGLTLGGVPMIQIPAATQHNQNNVGSGVFTAYLPEASLSTGALTLVPTYSTAVTGGVPTTPGALSSIIYQGLMCYNTPSDTGLTGIVNFVNVAPTVATNLSATLPSVPANSTLFTSASHREPITPPMDTNIGTKTPLVTITGGKTLQSGSSVVDDSGLEGSKTATWNVMGKSPVVLVAFDHATSDGPEEPVIPGVPTITSVTASSDFQLTATWGAATNAASYQIKWGQVVSPNVPAGSPVTATSPRVITGLAGAVSYGVQVRSVSASGEVSAWSPTVYRVTTGNPGGGGVFSSNRMMATTNAYAASYSQGNGPMRWPDDVNVSTVLGRSNVSSTESALSNMAVHPDVTATVSRYQSRNPARESAFVNERGPLIIWTSKLGLTTYNNNSKSTGAQAALSLLDTAKTGSKGTINRDDVWLKIGNDLNTTIKVGTGPTHIRKDIVALSLFHETNGPWSKSGYMGVNLLLRNQPSLLAVTRAQYGNEMYEAIQIAATTGECAYVHRLAVERAIDLIRSRCPTAMLGGTPADGAASTPEAGVPINNGTSWVWDAFPRRQLDFLMPTCYAGAITHTGGSTTNAANYSRQHGWLEHIKDFYDYYNCPGGLLEGGCHYALPGVTPGTPVSVTDNGGWAFFEKMYETVLPDAFGPKGSVGINNWFVLNWAAAANPGAGRSFHLLEGMWGPYPNGVSPTSTAKPSWSTQATPTNRYPRILGWFKENFA